MKIYKQLLRGACLGVITFALLVTSACWGGASASPSHKLISQLDNNAIAAREAQLTLKELVDLKLFAQESAQALGGKVEGFRAANRQLIDFADSPEFKSVGPNGERVITFTVAGKIKAEQLAEILKTTAQAVLASKDLFPNISDAARAKWTALIQAVDQTAKLAIQLINQLKTKPNTPTAFVIAPADIELLNHAKEAFVE